MNKDFVVLSFEECQNLIDALEEWRDVVGAKSLEDNEVGLNDSRLSDILYKLKQAK